MSIILNKVLTGVGAAVLIAAAAGCGSGASSSAGSTVSIVASTDVWGSVAEQVAGDLAGKQVSIRSVISDPAADPHSYEADTRTQLALSKADVVIENGGGYDDFVHRMLASHRKKGAVVLDAVDISGKQSAGGALNEHVWYDLPTVRKVSDRVATELGRLDPAHRTTYQQNAASFDQQLAGMEQTEAQVKAAHAGVGVAITEPVPVYLLDACGLVNKTPPAFSEAIEEGNDVPVAVLKQTLDLFTGRSVALLAYNEQTSGAETEAVLKAARSNGVAVVPVTETLPAGTTYVTWMQGNLAAVQKALG